MKVQTFNPYTFAPVSVVLAKDLVGRYFSKNAGGESLSNYSPGNKLIPYRIDQEFTGKDLLEVRYEQLMNYVTNEELEKNAFRIIAGDFVTTEEGTGIVHTASIFGADDFKVAQQNGVPSVLVLDENGQKVPLVDKQGKFVKEVTDFAGKFVKAEYYDDATLSNPDFKPTDVLIAIKLKETNKAFKVEKYEHSYPHCWRTDKPVLYYPLDAWFIKTTAIKDRLVELNKTINWKPETTGSGRFGSWLENLVDWNLSRSRYWGTPLPIWVTEDRQEMKCIGSLEELQTEVEKSISAGFMSASLPADFDLHRPYVDEVYLVSEQGKRMVREPDLIDVWFDSGAMPYAQWHYPFENKDVFDANYPADFIAEGVDQTRGWFFTLHAISVLLFDSIAYKTVIANGLVLDREGNKMSKRYGNAVDPMETLAKYGADATRWYMISNANPWDNLKFDLEGVAEVQRKFFGTLSNTYSFFSLYANLDGFVVGHGEKIPFADRPRFDRWILSELQVLIVNVCAYYQDYEPTKVARDIQDFVNDQLSNWYVRLSRKRFWKSEFNADKQSAYETLHECLKVVSQLMSPIAPFYADWLYQNLTQQKKSVHLTQLVKSDSHQIEESLSRSMRLAQSISSLVHSLRKKEKIKVRQPLQKILIPILKPEVEKDIRNVEELIMTEINVKEIAYMTNASGIVVKKIKPNYRKLGKQFGSKMQWVATIIKDFDQEKIATIERDGKIEIELEGKKTSLDIEDFEITSEDIPGWLVASQGTVTVALDVTVTDDLRREGLSRDVVNRIQNLRKDSGLDVQDKISVVFSTNDLMMQEAVKQFEGYIKEETQALSISSQTNLQRGKVFDIDGIEIRFVIEEVT